MFPRIRVRRPSGTTSLVVDEGHLLFPRLVYLTVTRTTMKRIAEEIPAERIRWDVASNTSLDVIALSYQTRHHPMQHRTQSNDVA